MPRQAETQRTMQNNNKHPPGAGIDSELYETRNLKYTDFSEKYVGTRKY
jgi:hypothetical protein